MKIKSYVNVTYKHDDRLKEDDRLARPFRIAVLTPFGTDIINRISERLILNPAHIVDYARAYFIMDKRDQRAREKFMDDKENYEYQKIF